MIRIKLITNLVIKRNSMLPDLLVCVESVAFVIVPYFFEGMRLGFGGGTSSLESSLLFTSGTFS